MVTAAVFSIAVAIAVAIVVGLGLLVASIFLAVAVVAAVVITAGLVAVLGIVGVIVFAAPIVLFVIATGLLVSTVLSVAVRGPAGRPTAVRRSRRPAVVLRMGPHRRRTTPRPSVRTRRGRTARLPVAPRQGAGQSTRAALDAEPAYASRAVPELERV